MKAKAFIDQGDLVPDDITVPMILNRLQEADCEEGLAPGRLPPESRPGGGAVEGPSGRGT